MTHVPYTSDVLWHFVGSAEPDNDDLNCETLLKVLRLGCVSFPPHSREPGYGRLVIDVDQTLFSEKLIAPQITCFADIPDQSLGRHITRYGRFGLGFPRSDLMRVGARPVMYYPVFKRRQDDILSYTGLRNIEATYRGLSEYVDARVPERTEKEWLALPPDMQYRVGVVPTTDEVRLRMVSSVFERDFLAFIKPFDADLPTHDPASYYMEREWRLVGRFPFEFPQVTTIRVAPGFSNRITAEFPELTDRIVEAS